MSKPESIMIDDVKYVRADAVNQDVNGDIKIVILQRGWVMVGRLTRNGTDCVLSNASTIRRWGTTKGLGELAANGALQNTRPRSNSGEHNTNHCRNVSCS